MGWPGKRLVAKSMSSNPAQSRSNCWDSGSYVGHYYPSLRGIWYYAEVLGCSITGVGGEATLLTFEEQRSRMLNALQRIVMPQMPGTPLKRNASPEKFRKDNQGFSAISWLKYL